MTRIVHPANPVLTIDVAHPPMSQENVESALHNALHRLSSPSGARVLKIIHGYGSSGKGGTTKDVVLNWTFKHRSRFQAVIKGEDYTLFQRDVQQMRQAVGLFDDVDLRTPNPGITICWLK